MLFSQLINNEFNFYKPVDIPMYYFLHDTYLYILSSEEIFLLERLITHDPTIAMFHELGEWRKGYKRDHAMYDNTLFYFGVAQYAIGSG